ncbi:hypothetical protein BpHYR1_020031, partial [Brachionus plicatilis]
EVSLRKPFFRIFCSTSFRFIDKLPLTFVLNAFILFLIFVLISVFFNDCFGANYNIDIGPIDIQHCLNTHCLASVESNDFS